MLEPLGAGGMGLVYSAYDAELDRKVALKILRPGTGGAPEELRSRVQREAQALARLNHPNVTAVYEVGTFQGQVFIAMELVEGSTLREWLRENRRTVADVLEVFIQAALGLSAAHRAGVVHRDFKPDNVLVGKDGRIRVTDFGVARLEGRYGEAVNLPPGNSPAMAPLTAPGAVMGTPAYMAPEQIEGKPADARADLFSFCVTLYEALHGERPFAGETLQEVRAEIAAGRVRPPSAAARVPSWLRRALLRGLTYDRGRRFDSMDELLIALAGDPPVRGRKIALAVAALAIGVAYFLLKPKPPPGASGQIAVAVLPFVNLDGDAQGESFSDGMTEELMNALAQLPDVRVAARSSSFAFKGKNPALSDVGEKLGVTQVIEGSVRRTQDRVHIAARLENVADGSQLWAADYEEALADVFNLQGNLARSIATALHIHAPAAAARSTTNIQAYELYLRGKYNWTVRSLRPAARRNFEAVEAYEASLALEPGYAPAWTGLAEAYAMLGAWEGNALAPSVAFPKAKQAAQKALEIDATLAEAHSVLGYVLAHYDRAYRASEREFQTALRLRPDLPGTHHWYSHLLVALGRREESLRESLRMRELDPVGIRDATSNIHLAWHYFFAHEFEEARRFSIEAARQDPKNVWYPWFVSLAELQLGNPGEAMRVLRSPAVGEQSFTFVDSEMALAAAALGESGEVRRIERKLLAAREKRYVPAYDLALVRLALADHAGALRFLRETIDERSSWAIFMAVDPRLQPLSREPAFGELLNLAGLSEVARSAK
ncbi:MAG: protein kinase domain-containing protein [Myxococcales bacterium]